MSKQQEIVRAVAAHPAWKTRLSEAIKNRKADISSGDAGRDDLCDFGRWLRGPAAAYRASGSYKQAMELHAKFHGAVGSVVQEIERGRLDGAKTRLEHDVHKASTDLTRAMMTWQKEPE
jgi:hypothetical protein